MGINCPMVS
jgi:hypothetical protein